MQAMIFQSLQRGNEEYRRTIKNSATERSMTQKPEERDPEGNSLLIVTLAVEVSHMVPVISVALRFLTVKVVVYCLHHRILKLLMFVMIPRIKWELI